MIAKKHRFTHRFAVQAIYKQARSIRGPMVSLKYVIKQRQPYRLAVVVSKKVTKSAVKRNRIRRRIFESVRRNEHLTADGAQMIISVFDDRFADMEAKNSESVIINLLKQVK